MREQKITRQVIPVYTLTEICNRDDQNAVKRLIPIKSASNTEYYFRTLKLSKTESFSVNQMEMVLDPDGSPWAEACLYILSRVEDSYDYKGVISASNIASGLTVFRQFLIDYGVDYLKFPRNKQQRPTYRYRSYLKDLIRSGQIAKSTGQRFMQSVISFYKWLSTERGFSPENQMWKEQDKYIDFKDSYGFSKVKHVKSTNLSIPSYRETAPDDFTINDGGKLKPLTMDEQLDLTKALFKLGNFEMTMIHLLALFTGARIQTVLTLKVRHFRVELPDDLPEIRLPCGPGTGIDTKHDKKLTIFIPRWLHDRLSIYVNSERAVKRRLKSDRGDTDANYVFLSNRGSPFYEDSIDRNTFDPYQTKKYRASAGTVRTFIAERVLPELKRTYGNNFSYQFHDLRASFGMNLSDSFTES
ncbi:hypothetical protein KDW99_11520 [Marinomonas rhizomae]|uniref:hypothetical protein n=1 Tax=Marinomonas rhizomae TaxID=491948 RepID=UPI002105CBFB|nr:hypothetical protein [Marinomonas rhizomae]UTV97927.1 hypothetical protein KDW99_11520 [Marinomonas rhizomae]